MGDTYQRQGMPLNNKSSFSPLHNSMIGHKEDDKMKQKFNLSSLNSKMICYICATVLVVCGGLGGISYAVASSALHDSVTSSLQKIAEESAGNVSTRAAAHISTLNALTKNKLFEDINANKAEIDATLSKEAKDLGYLNVFMVDKAGNATFQGKTISVAQRDYFKKAISGTSTISDPLISASDKTMSY